ALRKLRDEDNPGRFAPFIQALAAGTFTPDPDDDDDANALHAAPAGQPTLLENRLNDSLMGAGVLRLLLDLTLRWMTPSREDWGAWLVELSATTIAEAMHLACVT